MLKSDTVEHINIATGIDVYRNGKVCVCLLNGGSSSATFPVGIRPKNNVSAVVRGTASGSTRQVCVITLQTDGAFSTSYFVPNSTTANSFSGSLHGQFVYTI